AYLWSAKLGNARLEGAQLGSAIFIGADLNGADLRGAYFQGTVLNDVNLRGANLEDADLRGALGLTAGQVCSAKSLQGALLDDALLTQVNAQCGPQPTGQSPAIAPVATASPAAANPPPPAAH
ncbi:MAG: pentapeptide repeat-containing protein, partial [Candidatus Binataceae bacterium]